MSRKKLSPMRCIESGDLFFFTRYKDVKEAAVWYIFDIMQLKSATLGMTIVVKDNYDGDVLVAFETKDLLEELQSKYQEMRFKIKNDRIHFGRLPLGLGRGSKFERWRGIYRIGTKMFKPRDDLWINQAVSRSPITGELP